MQAAYPVLFTKTKDCILVEVPDLEVLTEGKDMENAIEMARHFLVGSIMKLNMQELMFQGCCRKR